MGIFDTLKSLADEVNNAADDFGKATVDDYGEPAYTLSTALQLGNLHRQIDIKDEQDNVKYYTKSSVVAIKGKTDIMDADGNVIAHLEKKPVSLHEKHFVTMSDGTSFTLSNEILHVFKDITNIEGLGWQLQGNVIGLHFNLLDEKGEPVASVGRKAVSIHDKYYIDIYQPEYEQIAVAILIQLEKMLEARSENND